MNDTTTLPLRRLRGVAAREALFRAGFEAGVRYALDEAAALQRIDERRGIAAREGYAAFARLEAAAAKPKRPRRMTAPAPPEASDA